MKRLLLSSYLGIFILLSQLTTANAQYQFPTCYPEFDSTQIPYNGGDRVSRNGINYECSWYITTPPPGQAWKTIEPCGDGGLGPDYSGSQRVIGYIPYWWENVDLVNDFDINSVTHINVAFNLFQQNNNDFNSSNFASIAWGEFHKNKVDSILFEVGLLDRAHQSGKTISVAIGGATDFAFIWLMEQYYNNDAKMEEIANLVVNYVNARGLDGVDLDLECWWPDPNISGTVEKGGRVRGSRSGDADQGPEPAAIGLTKLAQKLRQKMPDKLISAAVFATSWYGNNYDDAIAEHLDWLGLMTYDYTGSWNTSPKGPHSALYKVPLNTYEGQSAASPIYSVEDGLEYWMGIAEPAWNHDGGFNVPKAKLCAGVPLYGYDFSQRKPNNGNGYLAVPYKDIVASYPNAPTTYDPKDPNNLGGLITQDGRQIFYNTPAAGAAKINYTKNFGHQGVIVWEMTQDMPFTHSASIMKAIMSNIDSKVPPTANITSPTDNEIFNEGDNITITATASDADGTVTKVDFYANDVLIGTSTNSPYSVTWNNAPAGNHHLKAIATDNDLKTGASPLVPIIVNYTPVLTLITISPLNPSIPINSTQQFTAEAFDQMGNTMNALISWSSTGGTINTSGLFTGNSIGSFTITASSGTVSANTTVTVTEVPVLTSIVVSPNNASIDVGTTQQFTAQGLDQNGNVMNVAFNWSAAGGTIDAAGLYTAGITAGNYIITATSGGVTGNVSVEVKEFVPILTSIIVSPASASIAINTTLQFGAQAYDQNNNSMNVTFNWTATGGTIDANGLYTAGTAVGNYLVTATSGTVSGSGTVSVTGGGCSAPAYVENGGYSGGSQVENQGTKYECKPFPYEGWCNGAAWAYAPGTGAYWTDAWIEIGPCAALKSSSNVKGSTISALEGDASTYPNPFTDVTNIKFKLSENSHVEIKVYNSIGIEVQTLVNKPLNSGYHKIKFDASELPIGHYIYIIRLENDAKTGRLIKN